ncbi:MAG: SRPBCC domain-containing protein [Acidobacteria bacterium]|nr:SRPBCC domain-containing protein [Acidobacteriota bacterium]
MAEARKVGRSIRIQATPEQALRAFLDVEQMKQWWGVAKGLVEERKGGVYSLAWGEPGRGYKYVVAGVVKSYQPGKWLRLEPLVYFNHERPVLGPMRLRISVREKDGRTRVSVRQDGYGEGPDWDWYYEAVITGWKDTLANLKAFLEGSFSRTS